MIDALSLFAGTGTRFGYSYWTNFLDCGRANLLSISAKLHSPGSGGLSGQPGLDVGTAVHALLYRWYTRQPVGPIEFCDPSNPPTDYAREVTQEAFRIFEAYRQEHDQNEFGEPVEMEALHRVANFYSWPIYHFQPDAVFRVTDSVADAIGLPSGGLYTVDFKNWSRTQDLDQEYCQTDLRFHCYMEAYRRVLAPEEVSQYRGNLVFANYKYKRKPLFKRFFLPIEAYQERRVIALTEATFAARKRALGGEVDNRHCVHYLRNSVCRWYGNRCFGY